MSADAPRTYGPNEGPEDLAGDVTEQMLSDWLSDPHTTTDRHLYRAAREIRRLRGAAAPLATTFVRVEIDIADMEPVEGGENASGSAKATSVRVLVRQSRSGSWCEAAQIKIPARARAIKGRCWEDAVGFVVEDVGKLLQLCDLVDPIGDALRERTKP